MHVPKIRNVHMSYSHFTEADSEMVKSESRKNHG